MLIALEKSDLVKRLVFTKIPQNYLLEYNEIRKENNYKRLLIVGIAFFVVQLIVLIQNSLDPFTSDLNIMRRYFVFYFIAIGLNLILLLLIYVIKRINIKANKFLSLLLVVHIFVLHFWAMGVAIADQFQGEDIVVYYLSMFIFAIIINVSVVELAAVLISLNVLFISLLPVYNSFVNGQNNLLMDSFVFIFFSLIIRYYLSDLLIKDYNQSKRLVEINNQLEYLSYYDSLSDLNNRRKWEDDYNEMYLKCFDEQKALSVVLLDIDYFKQYNDFYGHVKGDGIIKSVGDALKTIYSSYSSNIGRYGGDEFIVSIKDISERENLELIKKLQEFVTSLDIEHIESKVSNRLSVSVGSYYLIPDIINGQWDFVAQADKNLYFQKENR